MHTHIKLFNNFSKIRLLDNTRYILYPIIVMAKQVMEILKNNGWTLDRVAGSHHVFAKDGCRCVSVPFHGNKDIGNLAKRLLKEAGIK